MEKQYCGNGRVIKTQYGDLTKISFTKEDLETLTKNLENGWVNCVLKERREPSEKGTTHYLEVDTWKPEKKEATTAEVKEAKDVEITVEDLPF